MNYISTRGGVAPCALSAAILAGLAPDGGLFVPQVMPHLELSAFDGAGRLADVATRLLTPFFSADALAPTLAQLCTQALSFEAPLKSLVDGRSQVLELFHGPTAAFKDFGARFLAGCMQQLRVEAQGPDITVLVATSGDTGSAVAAAFHGMPGIQVVILYPDGRVSPRQAHQLGCFGGNVRAFRVAGSFDDCQRMVKRAFADSRLREICPLASANSISLGRLLPQMSYYASAALRQARAGREPLNLVIPCGNLGNALAAIMTRAVGLPLGDIVLASNANRVLYDFLHSGSYQPRASLATLANAMDVGDPSNVERLRWLFPEHGALTRAVSTHWVDDAAIRARIREGEGRWGETWCPHTACAVEVLARVRERGDRRDWAVVATAHPAKFESVVEPLVGRKIAVPETLVQMLSRSAQAQPMAADDTALSAQLRGLRS